MATATRLVRGLAASAALVALLVGVPTLLALAVGWPLPRAVPVWADVRATFAGDVPLDPDTVWKVLACVVWIAWAQIAVAVAVETAALARGGIASPIRGLAHMQSLTGPLLSAAALLLPSSVGQTGQPGSHATVPTPAMARTLVAHVDAHTAPPPSVPLATAPEAPADAPSTTFDYLVQRRDTLWDLAERYLAPGGSTEEVAAAVGQLYDLNAGRAQPDGNALTDAGLLRPGWVLRMPTTEHQASPAPPAAVTVAPGDSLWEIAEDNLGDGHRYRELYDLNVGDPQPDGRTLNNPSLIHPGWTIELPPTPASPAPPPPAAEAPPPPPAPAEPPAIVEAAPALPPTAPATTAPTIPADTAPPHDAGGPTEAEGDESRVPGALGAAAGLLSAGLLAAVTMRRRRRRAERRPGTELPPLPPETEPIVDAIAEADVDISVAVGDTLRRLATALADRSSVPTPLIGTVDGPHLDLLLDRDDPQPPDGWTPVADGRIWRTQPRAGAGNGTGPGWLPTLVTVGALDVGGMLLNLEAAGTVGLTGDSDAATALALSITVELGVTALADMPGVHVAGDVFALSRLDALPGIHHHADIAAALAAADQETAGIAQALTDTGAATVLELRCRAPEEAWPAAVIIAAADAASADQLHARAASRTGVVAVLVGGECPSGALEVNVSAETATIPALGLSCTPQRLDATNLEAIATLLEAADAPCAPPEAPGPLTLFSDTELDDDGDEAAPKLHVRLLGPITVEGVDLRPQQLALLAYLALHPDVTADAVRDAVWGSRAPTRERFLNTIHELRRAVGTDVLPNSTDGRYRLRRVWCDVYEIDRLVASAAAQPDDATADLRAALELVAGPPLTFESRHRRHFRWIDLGNHASRWERIVGDAAHDLASIALSSDDVDLARWAAERGLTASPASQTLTRDLVSAHLAAGDRNAAEHVVEAYARVLEDMGSDEPVDALMELIEARQAS